MTLQRHFKVERLVGLVGGFVLVTNAAVAQAVDGAADSPTSNETAAAADENNIGTVIVTAERRSENLQKVPIAISTYTPEDLAAQGIRGLTDLANITPSLQFTFVAGAQSPFLRGVGSNGSFPGSEAEVQTYVDGVYYSAQIQGMTKFNNIAGVEVDKGPQGTLFGRNATGGVIQITTRAPSEKTSVDVSAGYGSFNLREGDFYGTTGILPGLAADLAVHYEGQDGWGRNIANGNDAFTASDVAVRSKWLWTSSDVTKLTFIADYGRDKGDRGAAFARTDDSWRPPGATVPAVPLGYYTTNLDADSYNKNEQYGVSLKLDTQFGSLPFVSISSYRIAKSRTVLDSDLSPYDYETANIYQHEDTGTQEFQLFSPASSELFQWILGTYVYYNRALADPLGLSGSLFAPVDFVGNYGRMDTHSYAGYGQTTYNLTKATHITGGVRYTRDYRSQEGHVIFTFPAPVGDVPAFGVNNYPRATFSAWTGKVSVAQDFTDLMTGYVSYNRGFKSGVFDSYIVFSNPNPPIDPEYIDAFEIGLKNELLDHHLRLNGAAFYYNYTNLQVTHYESGGVVGLANAASAHIKGAELEFDAALTRRTTLQGALSWVDAKYVSFPTAPANFNLPITTPNPGNGGFGGTLIGQQDASGNQMPFAPKFSANLSVIQNVPIGSGTLSLTAAVKYQSKVYFTPDDLFSQSGYALVSSSARWVPGNGNWDVMLWGENLADKGVFVLKSITSFGGFGVPNEPRTVGIRVGYHFR
jgi:iron complex outermembrane recepter protein